MRRGLMVILALGGAGCAGQPADPRVAAVERGVELVAEVTGRMGCVDPDFRSYPGWVECVLTSMGGTLQELPAGQDGSSAFLLMRLEPGHAPMAITPVGLLEDWPQDVSLWLGGPGASYSVVIREDRPARRVVIEGFADMALPVVASRSLLPRP